MDSPLIINREKRDDLVLKINMRQETILYVPYNFTDDEIRQVLVENETYIENRLRHLKSSQKKALADGVFTPEEIEMIKWDAKFVFWPLVDKAAKTMRVHVEDLQIRICTQLWGAANLKNQTLILNGVLVLAPERVIRATILHELIHLTGIRGHEEASFYRALYRFISPQEYQDANAWLENNQFYMFYRFNLIK